jgi:hypothetical protein
MKRYRLELPRDLSQWLARLRYYSNRLQKGS